MNTTIAIVVFVIVFVMYAILSKGHIKNLDIKDKKNVKKILINFIVLMLILIFLFLFSFIDNLSVDVREYYYSTTTTLLLLILLLIHSHQWFKPKLNISYKIFLILMALFIIILQFIIIIKIF